MYIKCVMLLQITGPSVVQDRGRAYGNLGDCYEALGDFEEAVRCHEQYLAIAQSIDYISGSVYDSNSDT